MRKPYIYALVLGVLSFNTTGVMATEYSHLTFLTGCWTGKFQEVEVQENWGTQDGNTMLGTSKSVKDAQVVSFEFLRIIQAESRVTYIPYINGKEASHFLLMSSTKLSASFENQLNDFPQKIEYAASGSTLHISLSGEEEEISYALQSVDCP